MNRNRLLFHQVFYCNECGDNKNLSLVYTINLKDQAILQGSD